MTDRHVIVSVGGRKTVARITATGQRVIADYSGEKYPYWVNGGIRYLQRRGGSRA